MAKDKSKKSSTEQLRPEIAEITSESSDEEMDIFREHLENTINGKETAEATLIGLTPYGRVVKVDADPKAVAKIMLDCNYPFHLASKTAVSDEMWQKISEVAGLIITSNAVMKFEPNKNPNTKTD